MAVRVKTWKVAPARWSGPPVKIVMIADIHACVPWMPLPQIDSIVDQAQALGGDMVALLGDYSGRIRGARPVDPAAIASSLARLTAPLGVWNVFGNHDWYDDREAQRAENSRMFWHDVFEDAGLRTLENEAAVLDHAGYRFTVAGLGSQRAFFRKRWSDRVGVDDLSALLKHVEDARPTILLAHEPDIFAELPDHIDLTLSGHTHGGQIRFFGRSWVVPSYYGRRYAYGHVEEGGRHLVVSGGLGYTTIPFRIGMPPEITVVEVS